MKGSLRLYEVYEQPATEIDMRSQKPLDSLLLSKATDEKFEV